MTTSGITRSFLQDNINENHDYALYRFKAQVTQEQKQLMQVFSEYKYSRHIPFSYVKLFVLYLKKKYGMFKNLKLPSIADLVYNNKFQLISYC